MCMFRIKFPTKRIFRIFPILRTDGMAPFGTYLWNNPRIKLVYSVPAAGILSPQLACRQPPSNYSELKGGSNRSLPAKPQWLCW